MTFLFGMKVFLVKVACFARSSCVKGVITESTDAKIAKSADVGSFWVEGSWVGGACIEISYARSRNLMSGDSCIYGSANRSSKSSV